MKLESILMWSYFAANLAALVYALVSWLELRKTVKRWFDMHGHNASNLNLRMKLLEQDIDKIRDWAKAQTRTPR